MILTCLLAVALALVDPPGKFPPDHLLVSRSAANAIADFVPAGAGIGSVAEQDPIGTDLDLPMGLAFGPDGRLYVSSGKRNLVLALDSDGEVVAEIGADSGLLQPRGLAFGPDGELYVATAVGSPVFVFAPTGEKIREIGAEFGVLRAEGIAIGQDGHVFVASQTADAVLEFDALGGFVRMIGSGALDDPIGIAFGRDGLLYVASENANQIVAFDGEGQLVGQFGAEYGLVMPIGLACGPDGRVYAACFDQGTVHVFDHVGATATSHATIDVGFEPTFLAFSPFRVGVALEGELVQTGSYEKKHIETATLSYTPCFSTAMLALHDDPLDDGDLASTFGATALVFSGTEAAFDVAAQKRLFNGTQIPAFATARGTASLGLRITTHVDAAGFHHLEKAKGTLERSRAGAVFRGTVRLKP